MLFFFDAIVNGFVSLNSHSDGCCQCSMLNVSGESEHPCVASGFRLCMIAVDLSYMTF